MVLFQNSGHSIIECPVCGRRLFDLFDGAPSNKLYWEEVGNCRHVIAESDDETIMDHDLNHSPFEHYIGIEWFENGEMKHHGFLINTVDYGI